jgi:hypothetical protein
MLPTSDAELDFRNGRQQAAEDDDEGDRRQVEPEVVLLRKIRLCRQAGEPADLLCCGLAAFWLL